MSLERMLRDEQEARDFLLEESEGEFTMNFVTFGNQTINLDNVTHIETGQRELHDGTELPFIIFHFVGGMAGDGSEDCVQFNMLTWDKKPVLAYHEAKEWLQRFQIGE